MASFGWETFLKVVLPSLGTGGVIGYWIKSIIDARQRASERRATHHFDEQRKRRELLLEFLGIPRSEFTILQHAGNTGTQEWRKPKIAVVTNWIERNRARFPDELQSAFIGIGNFAGTMLTTDGLQMMQRPEAFEKASAMWATLKAYADELERELTGHGP